MYVVVVVCVFVCVCGGGGARGWSSGGCRLPGLNGPASLSATDASFGDWTFLIDAPSLARSVEDAFKKALVEAFMARPAPIRIRCMRAWLGAAPDEAPPFVLSSLPAWGPCRAAVMPCSTHQTNHPPQSHQ